MTQETFEQMVERVLTEFGFLTQGMKEQISTRLRDELAKGQEPIGYANADELDNMLDDRTATLAGNRCGWRKTPLYTHPFVAAPSGLPDFEPDAKRLALELECLLLDCKDMAAVSKWWDSAHEALEQHRALLSAAYSAPADAVAKDAGWQPIETAPKDGTSFDIWVKSTKNPDYGIRMTSVYFNNGVICGRRFPDVSFGEFATHWMPLPAAPDDAMQGKEAKA